MPYKIKGTIEVDLEVEGLPLFRIVNQPLQIDLTKMLSGAIEPVDNTGDQATVTLQDQDGSVIGELIVLELEEGEHWGPGILGMSGNQKDYTDANRQAQEILDAIDDDDLPNGGPGNPTRPDDCENVECEHLTICRPMIDNQCEQCSVCLPDSTMECWSEVQNRITELKTADEEEYKTELEKTMIEIEEVVECKTCRWAKHDGSPRPLTNICRECVRLSNWKSQFATE